MLRTTVRFLIGTLILAIATGIAYVTISMKSPPAKKPRVDLDPLVEIIVLKNMTSGFDVYSQGTVKPATETIVSAEVSGTISSISPKFVAGGVFQAGEVLMRIDPTNYAVASGQAAALVAQRTIEFEGASKLRSQGYRAEAELASAKAALAAAQAQLVRAQRNLERTSISLPYEGMVRAKETDLGQFVSTGTRLGVVFATDKAEVRLPLTDLDLAYVNLPGAAEISESGAAMGPTVMLSATQKGQPVEWAASIVRTEGVVDERSRVTYAVARVTDPYQLHGNGNPLPVGTFVSATIQGVVVENIIRVPRAVVRGSNELVIVDSDNKLAIREVTIARTDAEYAFISDGARPGERVVSTVLESAVNGLRVRTAGARN